MNKFLNIIIVFIISMVILFFTLDKVSFSENENRNLSVFPEINLKNLISADFTSDVESYINDHFPFRDELLILKTRIETMFGKSLINGVYVTDEYLFLKYEKNFELGNIVDSLNSFAENNSNVNMNLILVPTSSYINSELLPEFVDVNDEKTDILYVENNLNFESINVYENLLEYNTKYDVYFKSDHHYSIYGAYAVYKSFCEEKGINFNDDLVFKKASDSFLGTLSSKVSMFDLYVDDLFYYEVDDITVTYAFDESVKTSLYDFSYLDKKDKYSFFFGGNHSLININTNVDNDKNILIIKDSYANSFIPFLTNDYENIFVIDLRFYNLSISDFIESNNVEEVLFFYSTSGFNSSSSLNLLR